MKHICSHGCSHARQGEHRSPYRLPKNVVPSRYDIQIQATPGETKFSGTVAIDVDVLTPSRVVTLNAKNLAIASALARHENGTTVGGTIEIDNETEMAHINFDGVLGPCRWTLELSFEGVHGTSSAGFFSSTYKVGEEEKTILCTQFESADARSAFPCFDEPEYKATFKVSLDVPESMTALSNGDVVSSTARGDGRKLVEFAETLKMSTYIVCFTVGDIVGMPAFHVNGTRLQIWCVPGKEHMTGLAQKCAAFGLRFFEDYFGSTYPFGNKIDFLAVPGYAWGGMENPGLIIFQENCLLAEPDQEFWARYQATVIFHELAHQWFGNLVTPKWWNGLWLNESFATLMGYVAAEAWCPEWKTWDGFGSERELAYAHDSLLSSHPMEQDVKKPGEASFLVDPISYQKGCSVLYMIASFIGANVFRDGLRLYMQKHAFGNTDSADLWESLEDACLQHQVSLPIREIMKAWVFQKRHPEVMVSDCGDGWVQFEQRPSLMLARGRKAHKLWPVPIALHVKNEDGSVTASKLLLDARRKRVFVGKQFQSIKLNAGGTGFYRVRYDKALLDRLTANMLDLSDIEQYNLLNDARAAFKACLISASEFMHLIFQFAQVNDEGSWHAIGEGVEQLTGLVSAEQRTQLRDVLANALRGFAEMHGWNPAGDDELPFLKNWKPYHLNLNKLVQNLSRQTYKDWRADNDSVGSVVAAQAAMILHFGRARISQKFRGLQTGAQNVTALQLQHYLVDLSKRSNDAFKSIDVYDLFADVMLYAGWSGERTVQELEKEWPNLIQTGSYIGIMYRIRYLAIVDNAELEKRLHKLFRKHPHRGARAEIRRMLERVRASVVMRETQSSSLAAFLAEQAAQLETGSSALAA